MTGKPQLNIAFISDIHLGHNKVPAKHTIASLEAAFPNTKETAELDILFIGGDLFDHLLALNDPCVYDIMVWMSNLLTVCKVNNVKLRILEGTPSHDRKQNTHLTNINEYSGIGADCKYMDTVCVEYIKDHDIHVLYVPDEWRHDNDDTWKDVCRVLQQNNIEKVDYAIMHGMFEHQLPAHLNLPHHRSSRYLEVVRKYIFIGHVHNPSVFDRIYAPGSFDRIRHGEPEDKGFLKAYIKDPVSNENDEIRFITNKQATSFITVDLVGVSPGEVQSVLEQTAALRPGSHIRVVLNKNDINKPVYDAFKKANPQHNWTTKVITEEDKNNPVLEFTNSFKTVEIRPETVKDLLASRIRTKGTEEEDILRILTHI